MKAIILQIILALALVTAFVGACTSPPDSLQSTAPRLATALAERAGAGSSPMSSSEGIRFDDVDSLLGHGIIESQDDVVISAAASGRVALIGATLGDTVEANDMLVRLDDEMALAQIDAAHVAVEAAQANLAQLSAPAQPAEIEAGRAAIEAAAALVEASKAAVQVTAAHVDVATSNLQAVQARYDKLVAGATANEIELANKQIELARIQLWAAQATRDATRNGIYMPLSIPLVIEGTDFGDVVLANPVGPKQADVESAEAWIVEAEGAIRKAEIYTERLRNGASSQELAVAQADVAQAQANLLQAQLLKEQAQEAVLVAESQLGQTQAQVALQLAGSGPDDIAIAQAKIVEAQAQKDVLQAARSRLLLTTPIAGMVTEQLVHKGEVVALGARLFSVSDLDPVTLTAYVAEDELDRVRLGQKVTVVSDAYPDETFAGHVVVIASEAEFTPSNIQTEDEEFSTVFAVRISIPNPNQRLRPGMPASAIR